MEVYRPMRQLEKTKTKRKGHSKSNQSSHKIYEHTHQQSDPNKERDRRTHNGLTIYPTMILVLYIICSLKITYLCIAERRNFPLSEMLSI